MTMGRIFPLCLLAGILSMASALAQENSPEPVNSEASSTPEAYVYVSPHNFSTYAYSASSSGKLTPIEGSPYKTNANETGATNGKFFLAYDGVTVYSYKVLSNGAIGQEVSYIAAPSVSVDPDCSIYDVTAGLDHTGSYVYVSYAGYGKKGLGCSSILQTFEVSKTGQLTFKGDTTTVGSLQSLPQGTDNNKFAYSPDVAASDIGGAGYDSSCCILAAFSRESTGVVNPIGVETVLPKAQPGSNGHYTVGYLLSPNPTNHLAVLLYSPYGQIQLASFTVDSQGNAKTTNTWENMPVLPNNDIVYAMSLDPTGKFLAIAHETGVQLYHFDGAKPITPFTKLVGSSGQIFYMAWDDHGHLYALNTSGKMHVYNVTSKGMTETSGSKTVVPLGPFVVRSK
jgi:hypothetical protein